MKTKNIIPHIASLAAMIVWGGSFVWSTQVFRTLQPATTILFRLVISSAVLIPAIFILKSNERIRREDWKTFLLAAFLEPFVYFIGESYGLVRVSPTVCSAIIATIPLFTPMAAFLFLKEKLGFWNMAGFIISFTGVVVMLLNKEMQITASTAGLVFLGVAVTSAVCYGMVIKRLATRYNPLTIVTVQNTAGVLYFIPFVAATEWSDISSAASVSNYIVPLLILGVLASSMAYVLYIYSVKHIGIARSNVYTNLIPVFTAIYSYFAIGEEITLNKSIGIAVVILGLILSQTKSNKHDYKQNKSENQERGQAPESV